MKRNLQPCWSYRLWAGRLSRMGWVDQGHHKELRKEVGYKVSWGRRMEYFPFLSLCTLYWLNNETVLFITTIKKQWKDSPLGEAFANVLGSILFTSLPDPNPCGQMLSAWLRLSSYQSNRLYSCARAHRKATFSRQYFLITPIIAPPTDPVLQISSCSGTNLESLP